MVLFIVDICLFFVFEVVFEKVGEGVVWIVLVYGVFLLWVLWMVVELFIVMDGRIMLYVLYWCFVVFELVESFL